MEIQLTSNYYRALKHFVKNNKRNATKVKKTLKLFKENPTHPSLNLEKLKGTKIWTIRIDSGNRIFLSWVDESAVLLIDIGRHDKYRKY